MKYNLYENIHKLTDEFIEKRIPATEEDKQLYAKYMEAIDAGEERLPVFKGTEGADADYPVLTKTTKLAVETLVNTIFDIMTNSK